MTTAIYIRGDRTQVVLTAENEFDSRVLKHLAEHPGKIHVEAGAFYDCQGGWTRMPHSPRPLHGVEVGNDESLMIVMDAAETPIPGDQP